MFCHWCVSNISVSSWIQIFPHRSGAPASMNGWEVLPPADIGLTCLRLVKRVLGFYHKLNIGFQMVKSSYSVIFGLHLWRGFGKLARADVWTYHFLRAQQLWGCERSIIEHCTGWTHLLLQQKWLLVLNFSLLSQMAACYHNSSQSGLSGSPHTCCTTPTMSSTTLLLWAKTWITTLFMLMNIILYELRLAIRQLK